MSEAPMTLNTDLLGHGEDGQRRTRAQHEALMAEVGYALVRDTHLARVLPWRILEFQRQ